MTAPAAGGLPALLAEIPDPRGRQGLRHPLVPVQKLVRVFRWGSAWMNGVVPLRAGFMSAEVDLFELGVGDAHARRIVLFEMNRSYF